MLVVLTWSRLSDALISSVGAPSVAQPYVMFLLLVVSGRWFLLGEEPARWRQPAMLLFAYALLGLGSLLYADGYEAAMTTFRDLYNATPGDMLNACVRIPGCAGACIVAAAAGVGPWETQSVVAV